MVFRDRHDAGRQLARLLERYRRSDAVVVGLPRGGVVVAAEVAKALGTPLDVIVVRKLGAPGRPELGLGAIAEEDVTVLNRDLIAALGVPPDALEEVAAAERAELERRVALYRRSRRPLPLAGRTVILVDDGLATGYTARAAVRAARRRGAAEVILAVPVAAPDSVRELEQEADAVVALATPPDFMAVGQWYERFEQTPHEEVVALLEAAQPAGAERGVDPEPVEIPADGIVLPGDLTLPADASGLVIFAHGSGSSRLSPRNRAVAAMLARSGLATLLFDLLTPAEAKDRRNVFDIPLLASRLVAATRWASAEPALAGLPVGYFGASTGAGAALWAAAELGRAIRAVVSRGGRPDLAAPRLGEVRAPTLLIVGELDEPVIELNRQAAALLAAPVELVIVPGATHLFEEPGALETVSQLAVAWFAEHLRR